MHMRVGYVALAVFVAACVGDSTTNQDGGSDSGSIDSSISETGTDGATLDASADVASDVDAGPGWTPTTLGSTVVLWLDGDSNVTLSSGKVAAWGDKSSSGNSAVQGTANLQPIVNLTQVNTHKAIHFTPCTLLTIPDNASLQLGTGGFTVAAVVSYSNASDAGPPAASPDIYVKQSTVSPFQGVLLRGNNVGTSTFLAYVQGSASVESAAGMNTGAYHRVVLRRTTSTSLDLRIDGVSTTATVVSTDSSAVGFNVAIGSLNGATECLDGNIAELMVANTGLSGADTIQLETYFKTKYGL